MSDIEKDLQADVDAIKSIAIIPKLLEVICRITGMGFSAIARVTEDRWITCSSRDEILFGLVPGSELKVETTICHEIRQTGKPVIIDHVTLDDQFRNHHTPAMYGFESYISVPIIRRNGKFFGTLCAIDPNPHKVNSVEVIGTFTMFAELISFHLDAVEQLQIAEEKLNEERKTAELRDQFIAILGHDLMNPVGATLNAAQLLLRVPADERVKRIASIIQDSSYRMKSLVENILDFARGRMGDGIILMLKADDQLELTLQQVITELSIVWPAVTIDTQVELKDNLYCDSKRIAQLFSNLLANAITHGEKNKPVKVIATQTEKEFTLTVVNFGKKIPDAAMKRLFQPFSRGEVKPGQQGLGLGLYIASEIANAHGGALSVVSDNDKTAFTFSMPL